MSSAAIRALVVDDEPLARRNLTILLERDREIGSIEECGSGEAAVTAIQGRRADLVFLDVQMPECDGFDVLERLGLALPPAIVFVTAHDDYAMRAFEVGALDYLLKPFDDARFARALARAKAKIAAPVAHPPARRRFAVRSARQLLFIDAADVDWVEASSYYACLHVGADTHAIRRTMSELERELGDDFVRIHRSTIVNLAQVRGLELQTSGDYAVVMRCGRRLRLSRAYRRAFRTRFLPA